MSETWNGFRVVANPLEETTQTPETPTLAKSLQVLLADVTLFYHTVHQFHWNVTGTDFYEYHKFFDEIVSDVYDSIDPIAENIRKLGEKTQYRMSQLLQLTNLSEPATESSDVRTLTNELIRLNSKLIDVLMKTFDLANKSNQQGIANFIAERIDMHQKWDWFLKSSGE